MNNYTVRKVGQNYVVHFDHKVVYKTAKYESLVAYLDNEVERRARLGFTTEINGIVNYKF